MEWIAQLPKLESLSFDYTAVSDTGFAKLAGLTALTELRLARTDLTDASVATLSGFRNLRYLDAYHTLITEPGIERLKKALPACRINWSQNSARRERRS